MRIASGLTTASAMFAEQWPRPARAEDRAVAAELNVVETGAIAQAERFSDMCCAIPSRIGYVLRPSVVDWQGPAGVLFIAGWMNVLGPRPTGFVLPEAFFAGEDVLGDLFLPLKILHVCVQDRLAMSLDQ